ncbi:uncharacterized protein PRCAT00001132001 [Priceomyces carsonii]|uniref:uncharacterized protein n=1 Tax=Priceomyces carsonii TaxID=28549 RepID=UPI002ED95AE8|nr:unnamed protein product [Priceomyces carsonii]
MLISSTSLTHLPLLFNPLLNCLFNNPHHTKTPFKQTIQDLATNHNDFTILVPPSFVLQEGYDPLSLHSGSKALLRDLCYTNEEFIRSHILKTSSPCSTIIAPVSKIQLVIYNTMSGNQILIKNGMVFTGKGFTRSLKLKILLINYFNSFCDYFPKDCKFMLIFIEDSLYGSSYISKGLNPTVKETGLVLEKGKKQKRNEVNITFENLLRSYPLLSKAVSGKFYKLFHHNGHLFQSLKGQTKKPLSLIKLRFQNMLEDAYKIVLDSVRVEAPESQQTYNIISNVLRENPGLDLNRIVHEYLEMNVYDKLWPQVVLQFNFAMTDEEGTSYDAKKLLTNYTYDRLSNVSLNQLDIPITKPWQINVLLKRVKDAIIELKKLDDPTIVNLESKIDVLRRTFSILTANERTHVQHPEKHESDDCLVVDADTLIGLLVMVIIHSKILNLEAHLFYIKNFSYNDHTHDGYLSYILSNIDAVLLHLSSTASDKSQFEELSIASSLNFNLWKSIREKDEPALERILTNIQVEFGNSQLPNNHFLKSRNLDGESCLAIAIKSQNHLALDKLMNFNTNWILVDDILFDRNTTNKQNLLTLSLLEENKTITYQLIDILSSSCTLEEQEAYYNSIDDLGRSVGHYLFHDYKLIDSIGRLIDWEKKDLNFHTPLFTLCRCYDHSQYSELIAKGFECVYAKYGKQIDFDKHIDKMGNTLLHVILKNLEQTGLLDSGSRNVDVNRFNNRFMTPLTLYVKYNRLENLERILADNRLIFDLEDPKNFCKVFDYLGVLSNKIGVQNRISQEIDRKVCDYFVNNYWADVNSTRSEMVCLNAKYDPNTKGWFILLKDVDGSYKYRSLEKVKQALYLMKLENPLSILPEEEVFWLNFPFDTSTAPFFNKFRANRMVEKLNVLFISLKFHTLIDSSSFYSRIGDKLFDEEGPLMFEKIHEINRNFERSRENLGEINLTALQIQEIEYFLRYSFNDLKKYETAVTRFNKIVSVCEVKHSDLEVIYNRILESLAYQGLYEYLEGLSSLENDSGFNTAYRSLLLHTSWLEVSVLELLKNINKILEKTSLWKEIHGFINSINNDLKRYEENALSATISGSLIAKDSLLNINSNQDLEHEYNKSQNFFSFSNLLENKKARYKKLLIAKSEKVNQMLKLNQTIKIDHETIAAEISNFLQFRSTFLKFGIKRLAYTNLRLMRRRNYQLYRQLNLTATSRKDLT